MRALSIDILTAINQTNDTGEVFVHLIQITHPSITTIRLTSNTEPIMLAGNSYEPYPFLMGPGNEREELPRPSISIDNIDSSITLVLEQLQTPPKILHTIVRVADPTDFLIPLTTWELRDLTYEAQVMTGTLVLAIIENESFPIHKITPATAPGSFGGFGS